MSPPETEKTHAAHEAELLAADAIGDVIEHWGFRKGLGRVWTVLFIAAEPLPAAAIGERLSMSSGAVSMALTELQRWGVVHRVWRPGERREFFEAETDFWRMISKVFDERERLLAESIREPAGAGALPPGAGPPDRDHADQHRSRAAAPLLRDGRRDRARRLHQVQAGRLHPLRRPGSLSAPIPGAAPQIRLNGHDEGAHAPSQLRVLPAPRPARDRCAQRTQP